MKQLLVFLKNWALPVSMLTGIVLYLIYHFTPALYPAGPYLRVFCEKGQPVFIFCMLFCQFNKVTPSQIRLRKWHLWLLLLQGGIFTGLAFLIMGMPENTTKLLIEAFMVCMICPTATAAGVITDKLGGDLPGTISYVLLINLLFSILFPLVVPMIHPVDGLNFTECFLRIAGRIFPTLICPCILAWLIRWLIPSLQRWIAQFKDLAFYLWVVSLAICLVLTTRIVILSHMPLGTLLMLGAVSCVACALQFGSGKLIGRRYGKVQSLTAGQSFGQKNTGLMIWVCYTFLTPQTAVAGGFYSIWHNIVNSLELAAKRRK